MPITFVQLPVSVIKEGKYFIAYTPALDLSTSGKTFPEVRKRFEEVVAIFFEELSEKGTLSEVLTNLGWRKVEHKWSPPVEVSHLVQTVRIPQVI